MKTPDILLAVQPVIQAFEKLSIPYYIGGSIASSVYGMARATIKIDVFIHENEPYRNEAFQRKRKDTLEETGTIQFYFSSPEDIIIHKLQWYKMGGFVSERQWLDIIGVVKVQADLLDKKYLKRWSAKLGHKT
ncbi:MAG: hypothetical protein B6I22_14525 [Desulfobacteraceae bacterium 4572_123]|nr:MAG: hypothetical protein B6I22_14525 [Desulfobacteraceae bacterium 4572_123]